MRGRLVRHAGGLLEGLKAYRGHLRGTPDYSGIPTHECVCGCNVFRIVAGSDDYSLSWHSLTGYCFGCNAKVTVPCELDRPEAENYVNV